MRCLIRCKKSAFHPICLTPRPPSCKGKGFEAAFPFEGTGPKERVLAQGFSTSFAIKHKDPGHTITMNTLYEIIGCLNGSLSRGSCQRAGFGKNPAAMTDEVEIMCLIFPNRQEHAVSHLILPIWGDIPERGKSASFKICFTQRELVTAVLFHRGKARSLFYPPARLKTGWAASGRLHRGQWPFQTKPRRATAHS